MRHLLQSLWCSAKRWPLTATIALSWSLMALVELSPATSLGPVPVGAIVTVLIMPVYLAILGSAILGTSLNLAPPVALLLMALCCLAFDRFAIPLLVWKQRT